MFGNTTLESFDKPNALNFGDDKNKESFQNSNLVKKYVDVLMKESDKLAQNVKNSTNEQFSCTSEQTMDMEYHSFKLNNSITPQDKIEFEHWLNIQMKVDELTKEKKDEEVLCSEIFNLETMQRFLSSIKDDFLFDSDEDFSSEEEEYWGCMEKKMEAFFKNKKPQDEENSEVKCVKPVVPNKPWVEKYRPKTVDDVAEQTEIVSVLKQVLAGADLPHFLFYGPPGTGKTSTILAASRELFGSLFRDRILELNASDDRGIQVIRDKVKSFAQLTASSIRPDGTPCPPYKIVILDEADSMTGAAQAALRRTMEKETKTTRFCLICNYVSSIIQPLTSRCMKFRFKPLGKSIIKTRLDMICKEEEVNCNPDGIDKIVEICEGDLRQAITVLQSCARLKGGEKITEEDVIEISNLVPEGLVFDLIESCKENVYEKIQLRVKNIIYDAYPLSQILTQIHKYVLSSDNITDKQKAKISEYLAESSYRLQRGASEYTQLLNLCCSIGNSLQENLDFN